MTTQMSQLSGHSLSCTSTQVTDCPKITLQLSQQPGPDDDNFDTAIQNVEDIFKELIMYVYMSSLINLVEKGYGKMSIYTTTSKIKGNTHTHTHTHIYIMHFEV